MEWIDIRSCCVVYPQAITTPAFHRRLVALAEKPVVIAPTTKFNKWQHLRTRFSH
jgi:hypothetical protein